MKPQPPASHPRGRVPCLDFALAAFLLAAVLGAGCRTPHSGFPVGIYSVRDPGHLPTLREAGFNLVMGEASEAYLDAARRAGIGVVASPGTQVGPGPFDLPRASAVIRRFDGHPALKAWYLSDEPDLNRVPPDVLAQVHAGVREAGARKPTATVLFDGNQAAHYSGKTDWLFQDRYPVPWLPLADFAKHLRLARNAAGPRQPLFAVIQAFDWSFYPELLAASGTPLRPPSPAELRAMTYLALVRGADGLLYYTFDDGRWDIRAHPATWDALREVVAEVRLLENLFTARRPWPAWDFRHPDPARHRNEALDPAVQATLLEVPASAGDDFVPAGRYLVAVNTLDREVPWQFRPHGRFPDAPPIPVFQDVRQLAAGGGWYSDRLEPHAVRIYGPLPAFGLPQPQPAGGNPSPR